MNEITKEQHEFLRLHRPKYNELKLAGVITYFSGADSEKLLAIAKIFDPTYVTSTWCTSCVMNLFTYVYTQYDKLTPYQFEPEPPKVEFKEHPVKFTKRQVNFKVKPIETKRSDS